MSTFLETAAFHKSPAAGAKLRKSYPLVRKEADPSKPMVIGISTASPDRHGDTVALDGWDTKNYDKNSVVLWAHESWNPPVGKSDKTWTEGDMLLSQPVFTPKDLYPFGDMIGQMVRLGFLNAASVGFSAREYKFNEERTGAYGPAVDFLKQELLEYSIVPIPANPEALVQSKAAGIDIAPYLGWLEKAFEAAKGPGFWISKDSLEATFKAVAPPVFYSIPAATKAGAPGPLARVAKDDSTTGAMLGEIAAKVDAIADDVTVIRDMCSEMTKDEAAEEDPAGQASVVPEQAKGISRDEFQKMLAESVEKAKQTITTALTGKLD